MTVSLGTAVTGEVLWSNDPRVGLDGTSTADQTAALQNFLNMIAGATTNHDKVGYLLPGVYRKTGELTLPNTDGHKPIRLIGAGGWMVQDAPTVIRDMADAGAGHHSLNVTSTQGVFSIENISFEGSLGSSTRGTPPWNMRCLRLPTRCFVSNVSAVGYYSGVNIVGDHMLIENCLLQGNGYGIEFGPQSPTQGDILIRKTQAGSSWIAGCGVARSSPLAGVRMLDVELSTSPYCIYRYNDGVTYGTLTAPVGTGDTTIPMSITTAAPLPFSIYVDSEVMSVTAVSGLTWTVSRAQNGTTAATHTSATSVYPWLSNWIIGLWTENIATEYTGNGIVYDGVGDGAGVTQVTWDNGIVNWGLYSANNWVGQPQTAAWYNSGAFSDVTFTGAMPTATATQPSIKGSILTRILCYNGEGYPNSLANGFMPFAATATLNQSRVGQCAIGDARGQRTLIVPYSAAGTINRGFCLTSNNEVDTVQYSGPVGGRVKRVRGIAAHNATSGGVIHAVVRCGDTTTLVMNTSASTIAADTLLVPDPGGGVAAHGSGVNYGVSGQVIGRMVSSCLAGALGQAEIFI